MPEVKVNVKVSSTCTLKLYTYKKSDFCPCDTWDTIDFSGVGARLANQTALLQESIGTRFGRRY